MNPIDDMTCAWSWAGLVPEEVVMENDFGNLVVRDSRKRFWRLRPEELSVSVIAEAPSEWRQLRNQEDFLIDFRMDALVSEARAKFGPLVAGRKYCLKIPAVLGGAYDRENLGTISFTELIQYSGEVAEQINDLPDGSLLRFRFRE